MKRSLQKRITSLLLAVVMIVSIFTIIPITASAEETTTVLSSAHLEANILSVTYDNSKTTLGAYNSMLKQWAFTVKRGGTAASATSVEDTITITNMTSDKAVYFTGAFTDTTVGKTFQKGGGSITISAVNATFTNTVKAYTVTLNPRGSISFKIVTGTGVNGALNIYLSKLSITEVEEQGFNVTVNGAENGTVIVNQMGDQSNVALAGSESLTGELNMDDVVSITAVPDEGYEFYGFTNGEQWFGDDDNRTAEVTIISDTEISPLFLPVNSSLYGVGVGRFTDLNAAAQYAQTASNKTIVVLRDSILPDGEYNIPANVTLVIPCSDGDNSMMSLPAISQSYSYPSFYRTLTLSPGAKLNVSGVLSVNAAMQPVAYHSGCGPSGKVALIELCEGSEINLNNSAVMYSWGYVTGEGTITANDTSTVYEEMQIQDYRGGTATAAIAGKYNESAGVFPFTQYYVQNIEATLVITSQATENITALIHAAGAYAFTTAAFIGPSGVFRLSGGAYAVKWYDVSDPSDDKLRVDVYGDGELANLQLNIAGMMDVDSANFVLPMNNIVITQKEGTLTTEQQLALLPGSGLIIDEGANVNIGENGKVFVYDTDDFHDVYVSDTITPLWYSPTLGHGSQRTAADVEDAFVCVDGTLDIYGIVSTSAGGANIYTTNPKRSEDDDSYGRILVHNTESGTLKRPVQSSNQVLGYEEVDITPIALRNSDGSYRDSEMRTDINEEFYYVVLSDSADSEGNSVCSWVGNSDPETFTVIWQDRDGAELYRVENVTNSDVYSLTYEGAPVESYEKYNSDGKMTYYCEPIGWEPSYDAELNAFIYTPTYRETPAVELRWQDTTSSTIVTTSYVPLYGRIMASDVPVEAINAWSIENKSTDTTAYSYSNFSGTVKGPSESLSISQGSSVRIVPNSGRNYIVLSIVWKEVNTNTLHTINWYDSDGTTVLSPEEQYFKTQNPTYKGDEPTKENQFFAGWKVYNASTNKLIGTYGKNATLPLATVDYYCVAYYEEGKTVTWLNSDGTVIAIDKFATGTPASKVVCSAGVPAKADEGDISFTFTGWTPKIAAASADATYTATYSAKYTGEGEDPYRFTQYSIALNGYIGVNFYFTIPELNGQKIRFTFLGNSYETDITSDMYVEKAGYYMATQLVTISEIINPVYAQIIGSDGTVYASAYYKAVDYIGSKQYQQSTANLSDFYLVGTIMGSAIDSASASYRMRGESANMYVIENVELLAGDTVSAYTDGVTYESSAVAETGVYTVTATPSGQTMALSLTKKSASETIVSLLRSIANYGTAAVEFFGIKTLETPADKISAIPDYAEITEEMIDERLATDAEYVPENTKTVDLSAYGLEYYGTSLLLDSGTVLRHYFKLVDADEFAAVSDSITFGGKAVEATTYYYEGDPTEYVFFEYELPAAELDQQKVLTIGDIDVIFSALDYAKRALAKSIELPDDYSYQMLKKIVTAAYWYNVFADIYFA